jgi:hypothetical protein
MDGKRRLRFCERGFGCSFVFFERSIREEAAEEEYRRELLAEGYLFDEEIPLESEREKTENRI